MLNNKVKFCLSSHIQLMMSPSVTVSPSITTTHLHDMGCNIISNSVTSMFGITKIFVHGNNLKNCF